MIKAYKNGSDVGTIAFSNDTEAVTVFQNGEPVENISAKIASVSESPFTFSSEYKKGLYKIDVKGETVPENESNNLSITENNKNLCNVSQGNATYINGSYLLTFPNPQEFKLIWQNASAIVGFKVALEQNTNYTFSFKITVSDNSGSSYLRLSWGANLTSEFKRFTYSQNGNYTDKFTFNSGNHTYFYVMPWTFQSTLQGILQVEKGGVSTDYVPFFEQTITIPSTFRMSKNGNVSDEVIITKQNVTYIQRLSEDNSILANPISTDITNSITNFANFLDTPNGQKLTITLKSTQIMSSLEIFYLKWGGRTE